MHASIGSVARQAGCSVETIRYYERIGLLRTAARSDGGHRLFNQCDLDRLTMITAARALGFSIKQIREMVSLMESGASCREVQALAIDHLNLLRVRLETLKATEAELAGLVERCAREAASGCAILHRLSVLDP